MTTIEEHKKILKEFLDDINEKISANLLFERQKILGFSLSEASVNLFAIYLHHLKLIEPGFGINHRHFRSEKIAKSYYPFEFKYKDKVFDLMIKQEDYRNKLCYGKDKELKIVSSAIKNLFELKEIIDKEVSYG
jgi:hypothetical protein